MHCCCRQGEWLDTGIEVGMGLVYLGEKCDFLHGRIDVGMFGVE